MKDLTKEEDKVIKAVLTLANGFDASDMNYSINCLIAENFSYFIAEDVQPLTSLTNRQVSETILSLLQKGIVEEDPDSASYEGERVYSIEHPEILFKYYSGKIWETFV